MPRATISPWLSTRIWSAAWMVDSRWAMTMDVRPRQGLAQSLLDEELRFGVEMRGGFVEDHHGRILEEDPGDGQALLFTSGQPVAALADNGVVAVGQRGDQVVDARRPAGRHQVVVGGVRAGVPQVGGDGVVEKVGVLRHHAHGAGDRGEGHVAHVVAIDRHRPRAGVVQPGHQAGQGGLAGARGPDQRGHGPGLGHEGHVAQHPRPRLGVEGVAHRLGRRLQRRHRHVGGRGIAKPHPVGGHPPPHRGR